MKSIQALFVVLSVALLLVASHSPLAKADDVGGGGSYKVAVIVTDWCAPCQKLKAALRGDAALAEFSTAEFIDGDEAVGKAKLKEVGCRSVPAIIAVHKTKRAVLIQAGYDGDSKGLLSRLRAKLKALNETK